MWRKAGLGGIGVVLLLSTLHLPAVPEEGVDATWQLLLAQAHLRGWRFGADVIFTYGPLGVLENHVQLPALYWPQVSWQLCSRAMAVVLILRLGLRLARWPRLAWFGLVALLMTAHRGTHPPDPFLLFGILAAGLTLLERPRPVWLALALATLTSFALLKFTLLLAAGFAVLVAMLNLARRKQFPAALAIGSAFGLGYLMGWKALGQEWGDLPGSLRWSWVIADGYVDAMQLRWSWSMLGAAAVLSTLVAAFAFVLLRRPTVNRWEDPAALLLTLGCLYLAWRHGTVRGDIAHLPGLFCATALWPGLILAQCQIPGPARGAFPGLAAVGLALLSVVGLASLGALKSKVGDFGANVTGNARRLAGPMRAHADWQQEAGRALAELRAGVASRHWKAGTSAGVFAVDYAALAVNPSLKPLPSLQSYAAYTPALAARDRAAFLRQAPDFMFVDLRTIDQRLAAGENLELLTTLLRDYQWVENVDRFLLFQRKATPAGTSPARPEPLDVHQAVRFGEKVRVSALAHQPMQMEANLVLTGLGHVLRIFFALPSVKLTLTPEGADPLPPQRLTWRLAGEGLPVSPLLRTNEDLQTWLSTGRHSSVQTITLDAFAASWLYREPFTLTLRPTPIAR